MQLAKTISTSFDTLKRRLVKVLRYGNSDVLDRFEASPYGLDSSPIQDMVAVYSDTSEKGKAVIIGYLNKNQLAAPGEFRIYATDANGELKFYIWQKANGTCEIGGDSDNMVRYSKLNLALQQFKTDIISELTNIALGITTAGGSYTPNPAFGIDISGSKIDEIKTL